MTDHERRRYRSRHPDEFVRRPPPYRIDPNDDDFTPGEDDFDAPEAA